MARPGRNGLLVSVILAATMASGCTSSTTVRAESTTSTAAATPTTTTPPRTTTSTASVPPTATTTTIGVPLFDLSGNVITSQGLPLDNAVVSANGAMATTGPDGRFTLSQVSPGPITVTRPAWMTTTIEWEPDVPLVVALEPRVVRGIRVSDGAAANDAGFEALLDLADATALNTFIFDTKREDGAVTYDTAVQEAMDIGAVEAAYDPVARLEAAKDRGLYTITRIVVFEDPAAVRAHPEQQLAWAWLDPIVRDTWAYPLALAVEACALGFNEVQFDYVRFPSGRSANEASRNRPTTQDERLEAIAAFLAEARGRLHPMGCAVSADVFGIVMSAPNDQGIGQRPEEISAVVDALSPMVYPSHYGEGWLGFEDPNDHPAAVTAAALDAGLPRMAPTALLRPWLQAFFYRPDQVRAEIMEAEKRGLGWMLWNIGSRYSPDAVPTESDLG